MQQLNSPEHHLFDKDGTLLPLKSVAKMMFNSTHNSDKQLLK